MYTYWNRFNQDLTFLRFSGINPLHFSTIRCNFFLTMFRYQFILFGSILIYGTITWTIEIQYLTDTNSFWTHYFKSDITKYADFILSVIGYVALSMSIALILTERENHLRLICKLIKFDKSLGTFIERNTTDIQDTSFGKRWLITFLGQLLLIFILMSAFKLADNKFPFWYYVMFKSVKTFVSCTTSVYIQHLARLFCERLTLLVYQFQIELSAFADRSRENRRIAQAMRLFSEFTDLMTLLGRVFGSQMLVHIVNEFLILTVTLFTRIVNLEKRNGLKQIDVLLLFFGGVTITVNCVLVCCLICDILVKVFFFLNLNRYIT